MRVKKRESLKKRFLYLAASFLGEMADEMIDIFANPYDFSGYPKLRRQRAANLAYQLKITGDIEKIVEKDGKVYFRFTDKGKTRLIKEIPLLRFQKNPGMGNGVKLFLISPKE